ncbi:MAG: 16S rRNA (uracil(1498)-N(3))-methyltransferase [Gammaproteobacteria bacterium]|nr:16S rRNA (uracil(1498)-N(3))-methyltransferase [Gammaproteobacteria bacterium]
MRHRLYLSSPLETGALVTLDAERSHYIIRVLRLKADSEILCFDGAGTEFNARIREADAKTCVLELGGQSRVESPPDEPIHLAQGVLKGGAMDRAIQKATELGATDLWPILADRSNAKANGLREARKIRHWQRIIESAAEQSRRLFLPKLHEPVTLAGFFSGSRVEQKLFLDTGQKVLPAVIPRQPTALLIGPEGGWSSTERELALAGGALGFSLGEFVLRAETTPLAALAALRQAWRWQ